MNIASNVRRLPAYAFKGCSGLTQIVNRAAIPQGITSNVFEGLNIMSINLDVSDASLAAYKAADIWKDFNIAAIPFMLNSTNITLSAGETETLEAIFMEGYVGNKGVTWVSDNTDVATVGNDGTITAKSAGTATIIVTTKDGISNDICVVSVIGSVPIRDIKKSDDRVGIKLVNGNIVSDKADMQIIIPNDKVSQVKVVIYDNIGNVVIERTERSDKFSWNLTNSAGRNVANGTYLVVAEVKGANRKVYTYSAKVGVKR
jgi:hypothetical protein